MRETTITDSTLRNVNLSASPYVGYLKGSDLVQFQRNMPFLNRYYPQYSVLLSC